MTDANDTISAQEKLLFAEIGRSGVDMWAGYVDDEYQEELKGREGRKTYRQMLENEPILAASVRIMEYLLCQTEVQVVPAEHPQGQEVADFIESAFDDVEGGIESAIAVGVSMVPYGFALAEKIFKIRAGPDKPGPFKSQFRDRRWGWRRFAPRRQLSVEKWELDSHDDAIGVWQYIDSHPRDILLSLSKCLHFTTVDNGNPEGLSMFRSVYKSYYHADKLRFIEAVGIERTEPNRSHRCAGPDVCQREAARQSRQARQSRGTRYSTRARHQRATDGVPVPVGDLGWQQAGRR